MAASDWKSIREKLGISQRDLARLMGVHEQTVSKWERDLLTPTDYQRSVLARLSTVKRNTGAKLRDLLQRYDPVEVLTTKLWLK